MRNNLIVLLSLMSVLTISALYSETTLSSLEDIASYAVEHNPDYQVSRINVLRADENNAGFFKLKNTSINATGKYNEKGAEGDYWNFSSTLNIPIIDQLSLSGTIEDDLSGQVGILLNPLAHSDEKIQSELIYKTALINSEGERLSAEGDALSSALNWMAGKRDFEIQNKLTQLKKIIYDDDKVRYEAGEITLDDLQESLIEWSQARIDLSQKEQVYLNSESALFKVLGIGNETVEIKTLSIEEISEALETIKTDLRPENGNPLKNNDYQVSLLNVTSAKVSERDTWIYEPDIQASANLSFDSQGEISFSAAFSVTLSPDQIKVTDKNINSKELQIAVKEAEQSRNEAELNFKQLIESISSSRINSEISQIEVEQTEILYSEALLLHEMGEYSQIELELISLNLLQAENSYFQMLVNEYQTWMSLKKYL